MRWEIADEMGVHLSRKNDPVIDNLGAHKASGEAQRQRQAEWLLRAA